MWRTRMEKNNMLNALLSSLTNIAARAIPLVTAATLAAMATAQNLVPNPSFEDTALCDTYDPVRMTAPPWFNPTTATPDIYECDLVRQCGIVWDPADPDVQASGWQYAHTGTRFAGAYHWYGANSSDTKEYFMVRLLQDLDAGTAYAVSLYYSRADGFNLATDRISAYFGPDSMHVNDYRTLYLQPQVDLMDPDHEYLTNAEDWTYIADTFVASGNERYMIIGSFLDSSQVNGTVAPTGIASYCYYYYDDVSVVAIGPSGIGEVRLNVFPQTDGSLRLNGIPNGPLRAKVIDAQGRLIQEFRVTAVGRVADLRIGNLGMGVYVVTVWSREGRGSARFVWPGG
ncbi:MAG: T9SS type A sorting domain-containing protein [Flavobacteriales bacterium]|nr:T9SS type A sorting domain-containing protein [Flavobacteriales bacterium]HRN38228.1 T9SS type A sorting domain-containing protein [Flavobacteriales bacterium]